MLTSTELAIVTIISKTMITEESERKKEEEEGEKESDVGGLVLVARDWKRNEPLLSFSPHNVTVAFLL